MKYILLCLALLVLSASLFGDSTAVATKAGVLPPAAEDRAETGVVLREFGSILQWFVYALLAITVISAIRIYLSRRRKSSAPPQDEKPETRLNRPSDQDNRKTALPGGPAGGRMPRKTPVSFPYILVMVLLGLLLLYSMFGQREQVKEASYSEFIQQLDSGGIARVEFTERDIVYLDSKGALYHTAEPGRESRNQKAVALDVRAVFSGAGLDLRGAVVFPVARHEQPEFQGFQFWQKPGPHARSQQEQHYLQGCGRCG